MTNRLKASRGVWALLLATLAVSAPLSPNLAAAEGEAAAPSLPLKSIPLASLKQTQARPLFSPSRRPPANVPPPPPPPGPVAAPPPPPAPPPAGPELALIGTIISAQGGMAIFTDQTTHQTVRLHVGDALRGWSLTAVERRSAKLTGDGQDVTLDLPEPTNAAPPADMSDDSNPTDDSGDTAPQPAPAPPIAAPPMPRIPGLRPRNRS